MKTDMTNWDSVPVFPHQIVFQFSDAWLKIAETAKASLKEDEAAFFPHAFQKQCSSHVLPLWGSTDCFFVFFLAVTEKVPDGIFHGSLRRYILVVRRGFELGVEPHHLCDKGVPFLFQFLASAVLSCVQPLAFAVVDRLGGGGPGAGVGTEHSKLP